MEMKPKQSKGLNPGKKKKQKKQKMMMMMKKMKKYYYVGHAIKNETGGEYNT
jgi:hypothetical protein